jgi:hypothetical protein
MSSRGPADGIGPPHVGRGRGKCEVILQLTVIRPTWTSMHRISAALAATLTGLLLSQAPAAAEPVTLLALGDSLTAGYGLDPAAAYPVKLEQALKAKGHDVVVINAGVSGDTAAQGAARLEWSLTDDVDGVIVELGANDALRGLDPGAGGSCAEGHSRRSCQPQASGADRRDAGSTQPGTGLCGGLRRHVCKARRRSPAR